MRRLHTELDPHPHGNTIPTSKTVTLRPELVKHPPNQHALKPKVEQRRNVRTAYPESKNNTERRKVCEWGAAIYGCRSIPHCTATNIQKHFIFLCVLFCANYCVCGRHINPGTFQRYTTYIPLQVFRFGPMPYVYFTAIADDPSIISCYTKGDKIKVEIEGKKSLPLPATNCTTNVSFSLKHFEHFDEDDNGEINTKEIATRARTLPVAAKETTIQEEHADITCNGCGVSPVKGVRYKCLQCSNYDLCSTCQAKGDTIHNVVHTMLYIPKPEQIINEDVWCNGCGAGPIKGLRLKCSKCGDYDLCETCSWNPPEDHKKSHILMFCVKLVDETENVSTLERTTSSTSKILKKASEIGNEILDGLGKALLDEIEKDASQIIVSDVDSVFDF
jgi:hypothetical protein